jgi:NADP-dependent 3-hydroxy acid dehydrogenase YdfG
MTTPPVAGPRLSSSLRGRRVVITGAAGGLGPTVARAAADDGARLLLVDVAEDRLQAMSGQLGDSVESTRVVDLLDEATVTEFVDTVRAGGPIDVVWHLVGGWRGGQPIDVQPLEDWRFLHDLLVRTTVNMARALFGPLSEAPYGRFAIISSPQAEHPTATNAAYAAAKAAAEATVLALADGLRGSTATANIVVVPAIVTPAMREAEPERTWRDAVAAEDIASALIYLATEAAATMNGQRVRLYAGGAR